ncbi:MAG: carboxylating nicotinate-nucleotide diphosphorylase [Gammaproteobacteria bacterium]
MTDPDNLVPPADVTAIVTRALAEDIGDGDVTASLIPADKQCHAEVVCREDAIIAGRPWFDAVYAELDRAVIVSWAVAEGERVAPGAVVCAIDGPARAIVTGERTALNFLQTLSATATVTRRYVDALAGSNTVILDTRKTLPGLRTAQKYAVRCGGGSNHRMGLYDAVLIKENHIAAAGSVDAAIRRIREARPELRIEVEVENMTELGEALDAGADRVLLDNFDLDGIRAATAAAAGRAAVEISGGIELDDLPPLGGTGADFVSVGALTKHVRAIDFSMRIDD